MIIAIDGPSGAGKSTVASRVAKRLDAQLIDTGALYRTIAYETDRRGIEPDNAEAISEFVPELDFTFKFIDGKNVLFCNGDRMTDDKIRTSEMSERTSQVSALPEVREALLSVQRRLGRQKDSVMEGRDIGTVVFPDAETKIYLTASSEIRAKRRFDELKQRGESTDFEQILKKIEARDARDQNRDIAPLTRADDATVIDSSDLTIDEVVERIIGEVY